MYMLAFALGYGLGVIFGVDHSKEASAKQAWVGNNMILHHCTIERYSQGSVQCR